MISIRQDHNYLKGYFSRADLETKAIICDIVKMTYFGAFTGLMGNNDSYANYCNYIGISLDDMNAIYKEKKRKDELELLSTLTTKYKEVV